MVTKADETALEDLIYTRLCDRGYHPGNPKDFSDLDDTGVYDWHEVETFCDRFFNNMPPDRLSPILDTVSDRLDELLESVDLSTYGLERVQLNAHIELDEAESAIDPQNPNPRGYRDDSQPEDPLDAIVATFNDRYFTGWNASPTEQRIKVLNIARHVRNNPEYEKKREIDSPVSLERGRKSTRRL